MLSIYYQWNNRKIQICIVYGACGVLNSERSLQRTRMTSEEKMVAILFCFRQT